MKTLIYGLVCMLMAVNVSARAAANSSESELPSEMSQYCDSLSLIDGVYDGKPCRIIFKRYASNTCAVTVKHLVEPKHPAFGYVNPYSSKTVKNEAGKITYSYRELQNANSQRCKARMAFTYDEQNTLLFVKGKFFDGPNCGDEPPEVSCSVDPKGRSLVAARRENFNLIHAKILAAKLDAPDIYEDAKFLPYPGADKIFGYQISDIRLGSVFDLLSLKNGDVLFAERYADFYTTSSIYEFIQFLKKGWETDLVISRGNETLFYFYNFK